MKNMHNENCCYKDEEAVLYALMEIKKNQMILISANEIDNFDYYLQSAKNGDKDITIDFETCDNEPYQLVYGALMFHDIDKDKLKDYIEASKGRAMIALDGKNKNELAVSAYADICLFEDNCKHAESIPFVALMQTLCEEEEDISITMFPCCDRNVWENMVNRSFLLACRKFVKIEGLTQENWKEYIDMNILKEAYHLADLYTGELDD